MKRYFRIHWCYLLVFLMISFVTSCNDDDEFVFTNNNGSSIVVDKEFKVSQFKLDNKLWEVADTVKMITIQLTSLTDNSVLNFKAKVKRHEIETEYSILIPKDQGISNSDYLMRGIDADNYAIGKLLTVTFEDEMLKSILSSSIDYKKVLHEGNGTKEQPYVIKNGKQFNNFLNVLRTDPTHAKGQYFIQEGSMVFASGQSGTEANNLYYGYKFAGNYDGNGNILKFEQIGPYYQIGLFSQLLDGAVVKNLDIEGTMTDAASNVGFLAGKVSGNVLIENVKARGNITFIEGSTKDSEDKSYPNGEHIGALIGLADSAFLTINNIKLAVNIKGKVDVGGVIGRLQNSNLKARNISTIHDIMTTVKAYQGVGFVCGATNKSSVQIDSVSYEEIEKYSLSAEGFCLGGVIGYANLSDDSTLKNCKINCNLKGHHEVGGLIGRTDIPQHSLKIDSCVVTSETLTTTNDGNEVSGLGGFIGIAVADKISISGASKVECTTIEGHQRVGGLIGSMEGGDLTCSARCDINVKKITAKNSQAGGVCGYLSKGQINVGSSALYPQQGMTVSGSLSVGGIVGEAEDATIKGNITMENLGFPELHKAAEFVPTFHGTVNGTGEGKQIGGIVGKVLNSQVQDCCFDGTVNGKSSVGGIVGEMDVAKIHQCVNISQNISGESFVGGIIGILNHNKNNRDKVDFHHLLNYGDIKGSQVGGIIGYIDMTNRPKMKEEMDFNYLVNLGNISGTNHIAGCIGMFKDDTGRSANDPHNGGNHFILNCANYGKVTGTEGGFVGGILGQSDSQTMLIHFSANHGEIYSKGENKASVGGIVGEYGKEAATAGITVSANGEIKSCCNFGLIHSQGHGSNVGGIVGLKEEGHDHEQEEWWWIKESYNCGTIKREGKKQDLAGICGYLDRNNVMSQCLNLGIIDENNGKAMVGDSKGKSKYLYCYTQEGIADDDDDYTALSKDDLKIESQYVGFNFGKVWVMGSRLSKTEDILCAELITCPFQFVKP